MFRKFTPIPHLSVWLIAMVFLFSNCNSPATGEEQLVAAVIDSFYRTEPLGNYRLVDQRWLSRELCQELRKCGQIQHDDSLRLKLLGSTDKPRMIEGDVFTSLLEGSTQHKVAQVRFLSNATPPTALAMVEFVNETYQRYTWQDTVELRQENGLWKIHDVRYAAGKGSDRTLLRVLRQFQQP